MRRRAEEEEGVVPRLAHPLLDHEAVAATGSARAAPRWSRHSGAGSAKRKRKRQRQRKRARPTLAATVTEEVTAQPQAQAQPRTPFPTVCASAGCVRTRSTQHSSHTPWTAPTFTSTRVAGNAAVRTAGVVTPAVRRAVLRPCERCPARKRRWRMRCASLRSCTDDIGQRLRRRHRFMTHRRYTRFRGDGGLLKDASLCVLMCDAAMWLFFLFPLLPVTRAATLPWHLQPDVVNLCCCPSMHSHRCVLSRQNQNHPKRVDESYFFVSPSQSTMLRQSSAGTATSTTTTTTTATPNKHGVAEVHAPAADDGALSTPVATAVPVSAPAPAASAATSSHQARGVGAQPLASATSASVATTTTAATSTSVATTHAPSRVAVHGADGAVTSVAHEGTTSVPHSQDGAPAARTGVPSSTATGGDHATRGRSFTPEEEQGWQQVLLQWQRLNMVQVALHQERERFMVEAAAFQDKVDAKVCALANGLHGVVCGFVQLWTCMVVDAARCCFPWRYVN